MSLLPSKPQLPEKGVRSWTNQMRLISFGDSDIDQAISSSSGPSIPLGTMTLVSPTNPHSFLAPLFAAEAIHQNHSLIVISHWNSAQVEEFVENLPNWRSRPKPKQKPKEKQKDKKTQSEKESEEELSIAWRYKHLKPSSSSSSPKTPAKGYFDFSSRNPSKSSKTDNLLIHIQTDPSTPQFYDSLLSQVKEQLEQRPGVCRILVPEACSFLGWPELVEAEFRRFLFQLRALVVSEHKNHCVALFISSKPLCASFSNFFDGHVALRSFSRAEQDTFHGFDGFLEVVKPIAVSSLGYFRVPGTWTYLLHRSKRCVYVEELSLPPKESRNEEKHIVTSAGSGVGKNKGMGMGKKLEGSMDSLF